MTETQRARNRIKSNEWKRANKARVSAYDKQWRLTNKSKKRKNEQAYRERILLNPERTEEIRQYKADYYIQNKERTQKLYKQWKRENKGLVLSHNAKRRAQKRHATPLWLTDEQKKEIDQFYILAAELSWLSEEPLHVDHIVPLTGKNVRGLHVPWNLQIIPQSWNLSKGNKTCPI